MDGKAAPASVNWWLRLRWVAQSRLYDRSLDTSERLEWAAAALDLTHCAERFAGYSHWDAVLDEVNLRCFVVSRLGARPQDEPADLACLVQVAAAAIELTPDQALDLSSRWRELPLDQIVMLRRHKNLLAPLTLVADQLPAGRETDRIRALLALRPALP